MTHRKSEILTEQNPWLSAVPKKPHCPLHNCVIFSCDVGIFGSPLFVFESISDIRVGSETKLKVRSHRHDDFYKFREKAPFSNDSSKTDWIRKRFEMRLWEFGLDYRDRGLFWANTVLLLSLWRFLEYSTFKSVNNFISQTIWTLTFVQYCTTVANCSRNGKTGSWLDESFEITVAEGINSFTKLVERYHVFLWKNADSEIIFWKKHMILVSE